MEVRVPQYQIKPALPDPQKKILKDTNPLSQDIVEECVKINGEKCRKVYQKLSLLGKGGFAQCFLTKQKDTQRKAATKIIPKKLLDSHRTKLRLANEIKLHKSLHNQYVVELYNHFEDDQNVYINLQICEYGAISDILRGRYIFSVPEVQSFVYGICHGLKYLHSRNIIHRDLKLGNIFLDSNMKTKIGDFGLACKLEFARQYKRTVCGTPNYIAPQVLLGKGYHFQIDIWALGVMIYTLFFTIPPFETQEPHKTYQKIRKGEYQFPKYYEAPPEAIDLIKQILVSNPANRPTLDDILVSPFMRLGGSIPLGLPPVSAKRAPTKKQLASWPCLVVKPQDQQKSEMNSTVLDFFGFAKKRQNTINKDLKMETTILKKQSTFKQINEQKPEILLGLICKIVESNQDDAIFFYLNNGSYGIYDTKKTKVYTCQLQLGNEKCQKGSEPVNVRSMNDSGASQEEKIQLNECQHRILLSIKQKQLLQKKLQVSINKDLEKSLTVSRINVYKDVFMIKFSNKVIQVVFKEKDGFIISPDRKKVQYFNSFQVDDKGKQISLTNVLEIGSQKQNKIQNKATTSPISSFFKSGKNQKNSLTMKKISYLKGIISETLNRNPRKSCS